MLAVVLVLEDVSVTGLAILEIDDGLVGVLHGPGDDPGLDLLVGRQLEHLADLIGRAGQGATDLDGAAEQGEGVDRGQKTSVGGTVREMLVMWSKGHLPKGGVEMYPGDLPNLDEAAADLMR